MNKLGEREGERGVKMKGLAIAPGTCGELVQGTLSKVNFHITCPINCFSKITVELNNEDYLFINDPKRYKVLQAVSKTMVHIAGKIYGASITIDTQLPISKGMASSTADISAACLATARALGYDLTPHDVAKIALSIEPSDGLFFPGIVAFDHVKGIYFKKIGNAINLDLLVYDFGGEIDTIVFNQRPDLKEKNYLNEPQIKQAINLVEKGIRTNNAELIAKGATISAITNQNIILKPGLEDIIDVVLKNGALGINTAHSGTLIGILFRKEKIDVEKLIDLLAREYSHLKFIGLYKLINGGITCGVEEELFCSRLESMAVT